MHEAPTSAELRAFIAVAEERHFTRAALRLGVARSSLSRTIRRLEARLGVVLLERTSRSVVLTAAGEELLPRAREILAHFEDAQSAVEAAALGRDGNIEIGIFSNGFAELTGPIISAFRRAHSGVRIGLRDITPNPLEMILEGVVDIALIRPPISVDDDDRLTLVHLVSEPRCALLPTDHNLADAESVRIAQILDEPFVSAIPVCPAVSDHWVASDRRGGETVRVGCEATNIPDVLRGVGYLGNVVTAFPSLLRFFHVPGVTQVLLSDMPATTMAVARRSDRSNALTDDLLDAARLVSARLAHLIPGGEAIAGVDDDGREAPLLT